MNKMSNVFSQEYFLLEHLCFSSGNMPGLQGKGALELAHETNSKKCSFCFEIEVTKFYVFIKINFGADICMILLIILKPSKSWMILWASIPYMYICISHSEGI